MLNIVFVATLAGGLFALLCWGVRTLPAERWQMLAAVPIVKTADGSWRGLNLTFYGFFSASGTTFGIVMTLLLLGSVRVAPMVGVTLVIFVGVVCVPASRLIAGLVERKKNTFTIAGAAFLATVILPWLTLAISSFSHGEVPALPIFAAAVIGYVLGESVGRLACLSFGCCYGLPLRNASPLLARLFRNHNLVVEGATKKAAYASDLAGEPLIPVQAITSGVFAASGLAGLAFFLVGHFRVAAMVPALAAWSWRACSELLRADYRSAARISPYQLMAAFAILYVAAFLLLIPSAPSLLPSLLIAFPQLVSVPAIFAIQLCWLALFLYYGRSRVTSSIVWFHVVRERV